jgi:hypothetical protein
MTTSADGTGGRDDEEEADEGVKAGRHEAPQEP